MILRDTIRLVVPGIVLGTLGALALTHFLRALLYGITPTDPATFAQLAAVMLAVAVAAAFVPAVCAASTDPMRVLRQEWSRTRGPQGPGNLSAHKNVKAQALPPSSSPLRSSEAAAAMRRISEAASLREA